MAVTSPSIYDQTVLVIDNYDSFTYNLVHYLGEVGARPHVFRNDALSVEDICQINPDSIVLSPGPCTPNEAGICLDLIEKLGPSYPIFGVCLGMQAMGQVYGGKVVRAPELKHGKVDTVYPKPRSVFTNIRQPFQATRYHSLIVERESLPACLEVTAESPQGLIMGLVHRDYPVHGVQFHPESIASEKGHDILRAFLQLSHMWRAIHRPKAV
jgi:anthranilate synthase component 2